MLHKILPFILIVTAASASEYPNPVSLPVISYTDFFEAAEKGTVADVRFFIDRGAAVNETDGLLSDRTSLHRAAGCNPSVDVLKILLEHGADIRAKDSVGAMPLHEAARNNPSVDVLKFLIANGADIHAKDYHGRTALHWAAWCNPNIDVLKFLLVQGADIHAQSREDETPLFLADTEEKRTFLRDAGGSITFKDIFAAAKRGTADDVRFFIGQGANVSAAGQGHQTPLHDAAWQNSDVDVLKTLLDNGADIHTKTFGGSTPMHFAASSNTNVDVLKFLAAQGADVNAKDNQGLTPLHVAAWSNPNIDVLKTLIELGADVHAVNDEGMTPLHWATFFDSGVEVLQVLVEHGADVNAIVYGSPLFHKMTPLAIARTPEKQAFLRAAGGRLTFQNMFDAAEKGTDDDIRSFIEQGKDVNEKRYGRMPLHRAAQSNPDVDVLNTLIAGGADVSVKDDLGATPLHYAAWKNTNPAILKFLILQGADINAQADNGWTPLHSAAVGTSPINIMQTLLELGADVNAKTDEGGTPIDYTESEEKQQILRDAGGKSAWL